MALGPYDAFPQEAVLWRKPVSAAFMFVVSRNVPGRL